MVRILYITVLISLIGCRGDRSDDCIRAKGDNAVVIRSIQEVFTKVSVEDRVKLVMVQDADRRGEVTLSGPENLLGQITTTVEDGFLQIKNDNTCNFVRSFDYEITVTLVIDQLEYLKIESIAEVSSIDTIRVAKLDIEHNALSDINLTLGGDEVFVRSINSASTTLQGKVRVLKGSIEEISDLNAANLICDEALVDTHTPLDCYLNAQKGLFVNIYNEGNIIQSVLPTEYSGVGENSGSGRLIIE